MAKRKADTHPEMVSIFPYLTIKIWPDGTAGGMKLLKVSEEGCVKNVQDEIASLENKLRILKKWLTLPRGKWQAWV